MSDPASPLAARKVLITAGPTHEPIDAVRYIANRSSGRLGIAIAEESAARGLPTTLLLGPTHLEPQSSSHLRIARFRTAADLQRLLKEHWPAHDILIMAAAVADYRPISEVSARPLAASRNPPAKIPRTNRPLTLELEPTPDLLAELSKTTRPNQTTIGFALEPADQLLDSAREKLRRKHLNAIIANPLETMDAETIAATMLLEDGREIEFPSCGKREFARRLLDVVISQ